MLMELMWRLGSVSKYSTSKLLLGVLDISEGHHNVIPEKCARKCLVGWRLRVLLTEFRSYHAFKVKTIL